MPDPKDAYRGRPAYSYVRFSSLGQNGNDSLRRQSEAAARYAARKGLVLDETTSLRDLALSAYSGDHRQRGAMRMFLTAIEQHRVQSGAVLLVEAVDRISREHPLDAMELCQTVLRSGIEIHTIEDDHIYSRESIKTDGLSRLAGKIDAANQYSQRLSMRKLESWRSKKEKARSGKAMSKMAPAWLRRVGDSYELIRERGDIVRRIFEETTNGIGAITIARRLNADGVNVFDRAGQGIKSTRKANGWHHSTIKKILVNRAVLGEFQPTRKSPTSKGKREPDGPVVRDYYPLVPGLSEDLYNRATQARLSRRAPDGRGRGGRRGHQVSNLFAGLCICHQCSGPMHLHRKGVRHPDAKKPRVENRSYDYLICNNARRGRGCTNRTQYRYQHLEGPLLDQLMEPLLFEARAFDTAPNGAIREAEEALAKLEGEIETNENRASALWLEWSKDQDPYLRAAIDKVTADIESQRGQRAKVAEQLAAQRGTQPKSSHFARVRELRNVAEVDGPARYEARARLAAALRDIIDMIVITAERKAVVVAAGGLMTFVITGGECDAVVFHNGVTSVKVANNVVSEPFPTPPSITRYIVRKDRTSPGRFAKGVERINAFLGREREDAQGASTND